MVRVYEYIPNDNELLAEFIEKLLQDGWSIISVVFVYGGEYGISIYEIIANK